MDERASFRVQFDYCLCFTLVTTVTNKYRGIPGNAVFFDVKYRGQNFQYRPSRIFRSNCWGGGMFQRTVVNTSHAMKVVVLYESWEDQAFYKYLNAFSSCFDIRAVGNACLCRFWFPDMTSYADMDHICHRLI